MTYIIKCLNNKILKTRVQIATKVNSALKQKLLSLVVFVTDALNILNVFYIHFFK